MLLILQVQWFFEQKDVGFQYQNHANKHFSMRTQWEVAIQRAEWYKDWQGVVLLGVKFMKDS